MFAPFRKGKLSKESYFANIGENVLSEPDCQLEVDSAKNDDFLVLSRYVEAYAPTAETDQESSPVEEIKSNSTHARNSAPVMSPLHNPSDQQDFTEIPFSSSESDKTVSEPGNDSDKNFAGTNLMHYPEYDNIDRERAFFENKDTNGNNVDDFAQLDINGLDEVTEFKDMSFADNSSPAPEHKDDSVKAILFTEEDFMGTTKDAEIDTENQYYTEAINEYGSEVINEYGTETIHKYDTEPLEANSQEKLVQVYREYGSKSSPLEKPSSKSLLRNDISSFKEENRHPNAMLPLPAPAHSKEKLLVQQQYSPRGAQNDSRFESSRSSTLPFGLISPPQPPVRTVMEYSYVTNNGGNNQLHHNSGGNRMQQMSSGPTTNRMPSYTRKAPAPFTIYDDSHDTGGLGSGYRLNSRGSSSNGSDTTRSRDSFFGYSEESNTGRSRDSFFSYGGPSPRNDFNGRMPMPPSLSAAGIAEEEEEDDDQEFITSLFSKVRHNRIEIVQDILAKGSLRTSRLRDDNGNSLLHVCAQNNLRKMASLVLSFGCEINAVNFKACSALDYAERYSFSKLADWLRSKGALRAAAIQ